VKDTAGAGHEASGPRALIDMAGERLGAEQLFRAHAEFISAFLHRLGVREADVDDVVQEVFMVAHRKGGYVPGPAKPRSWLAAIAVRLAAASRRKNARRREDPGDETFGALSDVGPDPQTTLELRQSLDRVQRALDTLDLDHRAVFVLYEIEGTSCGDIAAALSIPVGTVYSRLHKARQRFADAHTAIATQERLGLVADRAEVGT
jgi:RNA polymerase sigma-70 factor (ECF subfamily)